MMRMVQAVPVDDANQDQAHASDEVESSIKLIVHKMVAMRQVADWYEGELIGGLRMVEYAFDNLAHGPSLTSYRVGQGLGPMQTFGDYDGVVRRISRIERYHYRRRQFECDNHYKYDVAPFMAHSTADWVPKRRMLFRNRTSDEEEATRNHYRLTRVVNTICRTIKADRRAMENSRTNECKADNCGNPRRGNSLYCRRACAVRSRQGGCTQPEEAVSCLAKDCHNPRAFELGGRVHDYCRRACAIRDGAIQVDVVTTMERSTTDGETVYDSCGRHGCSNSRRYDESSHALHDYCSLRCKNEVDSLLARLPTEARRYVRMLRGTERKLRTIVKKFDTEYSKNFNDPLQARRVQAMLQPLHAELIKMLQCPVERMVADSGCTGLMIKASMFGKTVETLLDFGSRRDTSIVFRTADENGEVLTPICCGSLTVIMFCDAGKPWVVKLSPVYVFDDEVCHQGFLSPSALRAAWRESGGPDHVNLTTGSHSKLELGWNEGDQLTIGSIPCIVEDGTYYNDVWPVEALRNFSSPSPQMAVMGDVAWAIRCLEESGDGSRGLEWVKRYEGMDHDDVKQKGRPLYDAYKRTLRRCAEWDSERLAEDEQMARGAEMGVCTCIRAPRYEASDWVARRAYANTTRDDEVKAAYMHKGLIARTLKCKQMRELQWKAELQKIPLLAERIKENHGNRTGDAEREDEAESRKRADAVEWHVSGDPTKIHNANEHREEWGEGSMFRRERAARLKQALRTFGMTDRGEETDFEEDRDEERRSTSNRTETVHERQDRELGIRMRSDVTLKLRGELVTCALQGCKMGISRRRDDTTRWFCSAAHQQHEQTNRANDDGDPIVMCQLDGCEHEVRTKEPKYIGEAIKYWSDYCSGVCAQTAQAQDRAAHSNVREDAERRAYIRVLIGRQCGAHQRHDDDDVREVTQADFRGGLVRRRHGAQILKTENSRRAQCME